MREHRDLLHALFNWIFGANRAPRRATRPVTRETSQNYVSNRKEEGRCNEIAIARSPNAPAHALRVVGARLAHLALLDRELALLRAHRGPAHPAAHVGRYTRSAHTNASWFWLNARGFTYTWTYGIHETKRTHKGNKLDRKSSQRCLDSTDIDDGKG